jgi:hypothetical protein
MVGHAQAAELTSSDKTVADKTDFIIWLTPYFTFGELVRME